jgi:dolichol kinase
MLELRRKVAHVVLGTFFAVLVVSFPHELVVITNMLIIGVLLASSYLHQKYHVAFLAWLFSCFDRPSKFTAKGAVIFFVGTLIAVLLFTPRYAAASILVLSISDGLATIAGYYAGKHTLFKKKTIEGTFVFFICTVSILTFFVVPMKALLIALVVSATELLTPAYLDDNLTVPFVTGLLLSL